jgi:nucleoside-diphosphate-sugar epimerase
MTKKMRPLFAMSLLLSCCWSVYGLSTPNPQKVAVIGATGRLGRLAVEQLSSRGITCVLLVRKYDEATLPATPPESLTKESSKADVLAYLSNLPNVEQVIEGDVGNTEALAALLKDCTACLALFGATRRSKISDLWTNPSENDPAHAMSINYQGVANIIAAAKASNSCKRIVRITGKGETPNSFFSVLINLLGGMAKGWNYEGERLLRASDDVDYTIIRPGIMNEEGPKDGNYSLVLGDDGADLPVATIKYGDVATLCVDCLDYPNAARTTLTAMTTSPSDADTSAPIKSYASLLEKVKPDRRTFPSDMLRQHQAAVRKAIVGLGVASLLFLSVAARILASWFSP